MSFTLPRGGRSSPLPRILISNLTIRPRLPVGGSGLSIKSSPFSSHAVLSPLRTASSTNPTNGGGLHRPRYLNAVNNMHRQCMQGVRLSSTLDEAGTDKEQGHGKDDTVKAEEAKEEADEETDEEETDEEATEETEEEAEPDWDKDLPKETEDGYKARFPAIHDIIVKRKTSKGDVVQEDFLKAYLTLQGRKQHGRKPRVWVSISEEKIPADVAELEWPTGKEGVTKATIFDWDESGHDLKFKWRLGKFMEFQVLEKTLVKGNRRIWREVVQKGDRGLVDGDKTEKE